MKARRIITAWTPIKGTKELGQAGCLQCAIWYLVANTSAARSKHKKALESIVRAKSKNSKFAERCLEQLDGL